MNRLTFFAILAMAVGTLLVAKGLYSPLVNVPLIGAIRYVEMSLGGKALALTVIALLGASTLLVGFPERANRLAWLFAGTGLGLCAASLLAIYRGTMDKLQELGGEDVKTLLEKTQEQAGTAILALGILLFLGGIIVTLFERKQERW
jgi:hypothetical protein